MTIQIVILAAGQGKRMHSNLPKVLHSLAGKSLLEHVVTTANELSPELAPIVMYGHLGDVLTQKLAHLNVRWLEQKQQLGTGHAVLEALVEINPNHRVLILSGDNPLIAVKTLKNLIEHTPVNAIGIITAELEQPTGYGRIKRDKHNNIVGVVEEKDATQTERSIKEINSGIYLAPAKLLMEWLPKLEKNNAQAEYYLTDIMALAGKYNIPIHSFQPELHQEIFGVNDKKQLAQLERFKQQQIAEKLLRQGVTLCDPARLDVRGEVEIGRDVIIDINVILEGRVVIGDGCYIGPNCVLRNTVLADHVEVRANSVIDEADISASCTIGPFARIRPGTVLAENVHIGNFCEVKKSQIGAGSKVNHLSYIGDADIGKKVNVGAGTITCNYDGVNKHKTIIEDDVFIGSDTQLVAPVKVGAGAVIGAGSTITKEVPPEELTITHQLQQRSVKNWKKPVKN